MVHTGGLFYRLAVTCPVSVSKPEHQHVPRKTSEPSDT